MIKSQILSKYEQIGIVVSVLMIYLMIFTLFIVY